MPYVVLLPFPLRHCWTGAECTEDNFLQILAYIGKLRDLCDMYSVIIVEDVKLEL